MNRKHLGVGLGISLGLVFRAAGAMQSLALGIAFGVAFGLIFAASGSASDAELARKNMASKKPLPRPLGL